MALVFNEEQQMLRDAAKSFIQESSPLSSLRDRRDRGDDWSPELWAGMVEMGWAGITIPEEHGGLEFGYVGAGLVFEECGRTIAASPLLSSAMVCASLVTELGSAEQKAALLPAIAAGETVITLALSESSRFDPAAVALTAVADGDGYLLNGNKVDVLDAAIARQLIVVARTGGAAGDEKGLSLFLVDLEANGLNVELSLNADARFVGEFRLDSVSVESGALLGKAGDAWPALQRALDIGAALSAAELLGISQEAFERTLDYLKERKQFGVPVASFQALQHRAAQLFCELELCKSAVLKALQAIDQNAENRSLLASMAKAKMARTARQAVNESVQMHGGIGMTDEHEIGFFLKRARVAELTFGDAAWHRDRWARLAGY